MRRDRFKQAKDDALRFVMRHAFPEFFPPIKGEVFWEMRDSATGKVSSGALRNAVTRDASVLIARLMKGTGTAHLSEPSYGILALAVGTGDVGWNLQSPPPATPTQRSLFNEIARKRTSVSSFVTNEGGTTSVPTHVVDVTTVFSESEAVGAISEMGLIGGDASSTMAVRNPILPPNGAYDWTVDQTGKDTLVNYLTFPVLNKSATSTLSWTWRLTF